MAEPFLMLKKREEALADIQGAHVHNAIYQIIKWPRFCYDMRTARAMDALARCVRVTPCTEKSIVDEQGNPWSEHILSFLDSLIVLYRPVTLNQARSGPWLDGDDAWFEKEGEAEGDAVGAGAAAAGASRPSETDKKAFGAVMATTHAARILILITHAHHHILRCLWIALVYLSFAYAGTRRGVALEFLLDRVFNEWTFREDEARARRRGYSPWMSAVTCKAGVAVEKEWMRRARRVERFQKKRRLALSGTHDETPSAMEGTVQGLQVDVDVDALELEAVWSEMKGFGRVGRDPVCHTHKSGNRRTGLVDCAGVDRGTGLRPETRGQTTPLPAPVMLVGCAHGESIVEGQCGDP